MSVTVNEDRLLVDDVVAALTGPAEDVEASGSLREQMERAAEEFDRRTALAFGRALVDSLCEDPGDVRRLEALLILGLAHPHILDMYKVSLAAEGRRLCVLLESRGEEERARSLLDILAAHAPEDREIQQDLASMMRRCGEVDELIERCLARADEEVKAGHPMNAIPWLQEILLHDQTRRDVARMIRDLRFEEVEIEQRKKGRRTLAVIALVFSACLSSLFMRERSIRGDYESLPAAEAESMATLQARLAGIDGLLTKNKYWFGMFDVVAEQSDLRKQVDTLEASQAEHDREIEELAYQRRAMAESARLKALDLVNLARYEDARYQFQRSLEFSSPDWVHRERVSANIVAIQELLQERK